MTDHHQQHHGMKAMAMNDIQKWSFERLNPSVQLGVLACGVFLFFGIHNYLQEAIMNIPGFHFGVMLGYLEVLG